MHRASPILQLHPERCERSTPLTTVHVRLDVAGFLAPEPRGAVCRWAQCSGPVDKLFDEHESGHSTQSKISQNSTDRCLRPNSQHF